jgi:anti-anti-sigma regulatory factor
MALQLEGPHRKEAASGDVSVVHITSYKASLDEEAFDRFHDQLLALADGPGKSDLLLDFGKVECLSAKVLGTLVRLRSKLLARGRHMTVGNLSPLVYEVFVVMKLDRLLDLRLAGEKGKPGAGEGRTRICRRYRLGGSDV